MAEPASQALAPAVFFAVGFFRLPFSGDGRDKMNNRSVLRLGYGVPVHSRSSRNVICLSQSAVAISGRAVVSSIVLSQVIGIVVVVDEMVGEYGIPAAGEG